MTDIPLNTYIEWTAEDRELGFCPVPAGSVVTVWHIDESVRIVGKPEGLNWDDPKIFPPIIGYLVHELAREPLVAWGIVGGANHGLIDDDKEYISHGVAEYGGRVVKLVEVDDD